MAFEERFANGKFERLPALAQEFVRLKVAVIVTSGTVTAQDAHKATGTIPIVMATGDDPVLGGLVKSLARPGGNLTGVTSLNALVIGETLRAIPRGPAQSQSTGRPLGSEQRRVGLLASTRSKRALARRRLPSSRWACEA